MFGGDWIEPYGSIVRSTSELVSALSRRSGWPSALDTKVDNKDVHGKVTDIEPLVTKSSVAEAEGENVIVQLDHGPLIRVLAYKSRGIKVGDEIQVVEHHHGTGRVTHTLK